MLQYQKKPVVINVVGQFDGTHLLGGMSWDMGGAFVREPPHGKILYVWPGDWIIPAGDGHHYTMKDEAFQAIYEPVTNKINNMEEQLTQAPQRELTFGEKAVGITFNPGKNEKVESIKTMCAGLVDHLNQMRQDVAPGSEQARMLSIAITEAQTAQMWAVKAVTWQY